tara:strand:- start:1317 stop:2165 length:849 start_codon:yes stop_codon:yes gene_type:complete
MLVNKDTKIGVIGQGFVGTAVREGLNKYYDVETYDKFKESTCGSLQELMTKTKIIFVCLPTPMRKTGACDLSIVREVISDMNKHASGHIAIIKSTVIPGTTGELNEQFKDINIVFSPEFLTEANSIKDFRNQSRIILGGDKEYTNVVKDMFVKIFYDIPIVEIDSKTAELTKYYINALLATKVSFANEMKKICDGLGIDHEKVRRLALLDNRIGKTHLSAPNGGKYGFGGHCLPKDLSALINVAKDKGVDTTILTAVWDKNLKVRPEKDRDWEKMKGRAVSD